MLALIFGILIIIASGTVSYFEKASDNKKEHKSNKYNAIILVLILLGSIITFKSGCDSESDKNEAQQHADSVNKIIIGKQNTIDSINHVLNLKQDYILTLQKFQLDTARSILFTSLNTNLLQKKLINLQDTINKILVGNPTDAPWVLITGDVDHWKDINYHIKAEVFNSSEYPIHNVQIDIFPLTENTPSAIRYQDNPIHYESTILYSQSDKIIYDTFLPKSTSHPSYNIMVFWGINGYYHEFVSYEPAGKDSLILEPKHLYMWNRKGKLIDSLNMH